MKMFVRCLMVVGATILVPPGALAQARDPFAAITDPEDRALLPEVAQVMGAREPGLPALDGLLAKLPRPTVLRAMVQTSRAVLLIGADRDREAVEAIEEAMRLAPGEAAPKLVASYIFTFTGNPRRAADLWLAASIQAPAIASQTDEYVLDALIGRLRDAAEGARADRLLARMDEIGMISASVNARSSAALARVRASMAEKAVDKAKALIPSLVNPFDLATLYINRQYEALWPAIESWAGPTLDRQFATYLAELRTAWQSTGDFSRGSDYAYPLRRAGANQAVVDIFLPQLDADRLEVDGDEGIRTLGPRVAAALIAVGRGEEAMALLRRLDTPAVSSSTAMRLNFSGNLAETQLMLGRAGDAVETTGAWLATARSRGAEVNQSARLGVLRVRACALIEAGRAAEAVTETAEIVASRSTNPGTALSLAACRGDQAGARELIYEQLRSDEGRSWAIAAVQPGSEPEFTPYQRKIATFHAALRKDAGLRDAVNKVGRIMPNAIGATLPSGFVPGEASARAPQSPDNL